MFILLECVAILLLFFFVVQEVFAVEIDILQLEDT